MSRYNLLTITQARKQFPRSAWWYYDKIEKNEIAYHEIGGRYFIAQDDLDRLIDSSRHAPHGERPRRRNQLEAQNK
jgi:hypothetical protein